MDDRARQMQQALADRLKADGLLDDPAIENAFRTIPRHLFLPDLPLERVYTDEAIGTKFLDDGRAISSSSQPAIMAIMLAQLDLAPGHRVLEIGAGTGYNAALIAQIVGEKGSVVSLDIDEDIVQAARAHLAEAGFDRVQVVCCDGFKGRADLAPYDRIVLTVGATDIAPSWRDQLAPGGRLVLPLELIGHSTMVSVGFDVEDDHLTSRSIKTCGFMMLRGPNGSASHSEPPGELAGTFLAPFDYTPEISASVAQELAKGARDLPSEVSAAQWVLERDIRFLLTGLGLKCFILCRRRGGGYPSPFEPPEHPAALREEVESCLGAMREGALCTLTLYRSGRDPEGTGQIWVASYGESRALAREIAGHLQKWRDGGCASVESARICAYPADAEAPRAPIVIEKSSVRLVIDWPGKNEGATKGT